MSALDFAPWNAEWSGEHRFEIRNCRYAGGRPALWQPHAPGMGKPLFATPHAVRQRRAIADMLCTVCGEPSRPGQRYTFDHGQIIEAEGRTWYATTEAPVHLPCADRAMRVCPRLREDGYRPRPFLPGWRVLASVLGGEAVERDFGVRVPAGWVVIGQLRLAWPLGSPAHQRFEDRGTERRAA
jgi:hypothetical protein